MDHAIKFASLSLIKQYLKTEQGAADILDARSGDLVEAMPFLLQVINRQAETMALVKQELGLEPDDIWNVVVRLLKNIYFADANDEYRVLGLNPWCGMIEARERHRYLIRLFHPDRGMLSSLDGEPDFAAIINRAYTNISNGSPSDGHHAAAGQNNNQPKLSKQFRCKFKPSGKIHVAAVAAALGIYKLTPRGVWLALIVISLAFIAQKYWNSRHHIALTWPKANVAQTESAQLAKNTVQKISPVPAKPAPVVVGSNNPKVASVADYPNLNQPEVTTVINQVLALPNEQDATRKGLEAANTQPVSVAPKNTQTLVAKTLPKMNVLEVKNDTVKPVTFTAPDKPVQKPVPVAIDTIIETKNIQAKNTKSSEPRPVKEAVQQAIPAKAPSPQMVKVVTAQPASENRMRAADAAVEVNPAVNAAVNKPPPLTASLTAATTNAEIKAAASTEQPGNANAHATELSNEELDRLIKNLITSYNKGDLESFMQLLEDDVKTDEPGGKNGLRQAYAKLFRKTSQREMQLKDLNWQRNGEVAMTSPKYEVSVTSIATAATKVHRGVLQFEVLRREGRPVIHAFYHLPEGSSR